jgi:two-component system KDP operon response regulator KdpE
MPGMSGIEVCKAVRRTSEVPIIVLSVKGEELTKVEALDAGADDFVTKPFGMNELLARVRASLRRGPSESEQDAVVSTGDFTLDRGKRIVSVSGEEVHLTPKEFDLLAYLIEHPDRVITHRTLRSKVWGGDHTEQTEYLRVCIGNRRKKIEPLPSKPRYILTEPWVGYRFTPSE